MTKRALVYIVYPVGIVLTWGHCASSTPRSAPELHRSPPPPESPFSGNLTRIKTEETDPIVQASLSQLAKSAEDYLDDLSI
ncbi:MAG: hypothetical protein P1U82_15270 [Verrucomicrobiales bacterium]|jgi:hypothetical protein|nr:hypothetical protein [Verrucomicrobiales bacterium]